MNKIISSIFIATLLTVFSSCEDDTKSSPKSEVNDNNTTQNNQTNTISLNLKDVVIQLKQSIKNGERDTLVEQNFLNFISNREKLTNPNGNKITTAKEFFTAQIQKRDIGITIEEVNNATEEELILRLLDSVNVEE